MRKVRPDGTVYYYYKYKRKIGRPKKRGPKPKPKKKGPKHPMLWDWKVVQSVGKKQEKFIGYYHDMEEVGILKNMLKERNDAVIIPKEYINYSKKSKTLIDFNSEYLFLKKIRNTETESSTTVLPNDIGKMVEHKTNSERWKIVEKMPCLIEEQFWIYGLNPISQRKDIKWIMENFIDEKLSVPTQFIRISVFYNKVIFRYDEDLDFVTCKNISDAVRVYNKIEELKKKKKRILFMGYIKPHTEKCRDMLRILKEKTGWPADKLEKNTTRRC